MNEETWKKASRLAAEKLIQQGRHEVALEILRLIGTTRNVQTTDELIGLLEKIAGYASKVVDEEKAM